MRRSDIHAAELTACLHKALVRLKDIWEEVGIPEDQRLQRIEVVQDHLKDMLDKMIKEEEEMKKQLQASLERCRAELTELCAELQVPVFRPEGEEGATMLQLEKDQRTRLDLMRKHKKQRMDQLQELVARDGELCNILSSVPFCIDRDRVPSLEQLDAYCAYVDELDAEKCRRHAEFTGVKGQIVLAMAELERLPETSFERDVMCEDEEAFCLSVGNIDSLKLLLTQLEDLKARIERRCAAKRTKIRELWERLETPAEEREAMAEHMIHSRRNNAEALRVEVARLDALKVKNIRRFVAAVRAELVVLWDKCFYGEDQRREFAAFYDMEDDADFTEELLARHEEEEARLRQCYEAHRELFEGVACWRENWSLFRELDRKASDPSRLNNRGGNLLREQKQHTDLQKSLPKLEKNLKARIDLWERERGGSGGAFLVGGQPFLEYVQGQWAAFHEEKEREKQERQMKKTKQLKEESKFGAAARTPAKRRRLATMPTPAKVQKLSGLSNATTISSGLGATVCQIAKKGVGLHTPANSKASHSLEQSKENAPPPKNTLNVGGVKPQNDLDHTLHLVAGSYMDFSRDLEKASQANVKLNSTVGQY